MSHDDFTKDKNRAVFARLGKGFDALAALIVLMSWLSGAFVTKEGYEVIRPEPFRRKLPTVKLERKAFALLIE